MKKIGLIMIIIMLFHPTVSGFAQGNSGTKDFEVDDLFPLWLQDLYEEKVTNKTDFSLAVEDFEEILDKYELLDFDYYETPSNIKTVTQLREFTSTFKGQGNVSKVVTVDQNIKVYYSTYSAKEGNRPTTGVDLYAVFINDLLVSVGVHNLMIKLDPKYPVQMNDFSKVKNAKDFDQLPLELTGFSTMVIEGQPTYSLIAPFKYLEDDLFHIAVMQDDKVSMKYVDSINNVMKSSINYYLFSSTLKTMYPEANLFQ